MLHAEHCGKYREDLQVVAADELVLYSKREREREREEIMRGRLWVWVCVREDMPCATRGDRRANFAQTLQNRKCGTTYTSGRGGESGRRLPSCCFANSAAVVAELVVFRHERVSESRRGMQGGAWWQKPHHSDLEILHRRMALEEVDICCVLNALSSVAIHTHMPSMRVLE